MGEVGCVYTYKIYTSAHSKGCAGGFRTSKELETSVFIIYIYWVLILGEAILENRI